MALSDLLVKVGIDSSAFRSGISDLRSQSASLRASMAQMAGTIRDQVKELNAMAKAGKTGTEEFKKLQSQVKQNEAAFKGMTKEAKYLDKQLRGMEGPKMGGMMQDIGGALTGGLIGGGVAGAVTAGIQQLQQTFNETLRVAADFDDQLRKISATSGATSEEMAMLRDTAIEWGAKSAFSASESAQAMQYMAQAGWSAQQSMAGLPGVLNLAASSGEDLAMTASIVTDGLTAFKLEAADSARFADVLAAAAAASNTNVGKMGDTFRYVGPVAGALGFTIEDTALAIGLMANSGIKGEQAGTALRAMFTRLADPTKESKMAMEALGISLTDNEGRTKTLAVLIDELRSAFAGLTPAQQAQRAAQLAGTEAMSGALALITASEQSVNALSEAIGNSNGKAQEMADIMEGGVGGSLRRMQGAWESLQLTIAGSGGFARVWYDGWATVFEFWSNGVQAIKKDYQEFKRILEIGLFDALKESEQTKGIEAFGKAYKEALGGMPMDKLTDQMTRLTWTAEGQAKAFEKRNAAVMAKLAPPKDLEKAVREVNKALNEGEKGANNYSKAIAKISKTASDVYTEVIGSASSVGDFYQLIGDDIGMLEAQHRELESGMRAAWEAGGYGAANYVLELKRQNDEVKKMLNTVKEMQSKSFVVKPIATGGERIQQGGQAQGSQFGSLRDEVLKAGDNVNKTLDENREKMQLTEDSIKSLAQAYSQLASGFGSAMEGIVAGTASAGDAFRGFAVSAISAAEQFIQAEIAKAVAMQISSNSKFGAIGLALAGVAISGLFGMAKGALGRARSVKLADGGIITGRTMAEVGEYPGAAFNPEVVAPLDKLQAMLDIGGTTQVSGTFRVQGADLVLALDNAQRKMNKFRV